MLDLVKKIVEAGYDAIAEHYLTWSAQITDAPSRAARTAMARPLPTGASGSSDAWVPAPTTRTRRSARRGPAIASALEPGDARLALHAE